MIVRNEALVLPRLAASVRDNIDHWTIVDTGSTDDTIGVARQAFAGINGDVIVDKWRGYGPSRNVAVRAAEEHTAWLLHLDADETFHGCVDLDALDNEVDAVEAENRYGNLRYWLPRLVRAGAGWHWQGRAHEFLTMAEGFGRRVQTEAFWTEHHADGGNRDDKFERERFLLEQDWAEAPGDPRTAFYLARTFDDAGRQTEAITWYRRRMSLAGWDEETFYARFRLGVCLLRAGLADEGCGVLWQAWAERQWRAEPLAALAEHYRVAELWPLAWEACDLAFRHTGAQPDRSRPAQPVDRLFVDAEATGWRIAYEASISAWYVGQRDRGRALGEYLLRQADIPAEIRQAVQANQVFYDEASDG